MKRRIVTGLAVMMVLAIQGCSFLDSREEPAPFPSASTAGPELPAKRWLGTRFEDILIPQDFTLDYSASYVNVSEGGPRVADLRYTGQTPLTDVMRYVQRTMSEAGWDSVSLAGVAIKTLRYVKEDEECELIIHKGNGAGSVIMVRLHPRP